MSNENAGPRVGFVTGGGSGMGRATALRLARGGAAVAVFDRDRETAEQVAAEIEGAGGRALATAGDVTRSADLEAAVGRTVAELGGLDATAACAGIEVVGTVETTSDDDWARALAVNLTGVMLTARHAVPAMVANGGGSFVAIASDAGVQGGRDSIAYSASKHGAVGVVRCLALDHIVQGVRSNAVCPSLVQTPMAERLLEQVDPEERRQLEATMPAGRFATAEEVAEVIHHLLSPASSYTNGVTYMVDGGACVGTII